MAPKLMLLAGAPPVSAVTAESCTLDTIDGRFSLFLGLPIRPSQRKHLPPSSQIAWRSLTLHKQPLHASFNQAHDIADYSLPNQAEFFTTADVSFSSNGDSFDSETGLDVLSHFCDHSLAVHHNPVLSSQQYDDSFDETSALDDTSFMSTAFVDKTTTTTTTTATLSEPAPPCNASDLKDIPPARQILLLNPQTLTLNLVVGIISIAQPRTVTTRWGTALSLVEMLVGDDTKSGFAVSFWLSKDAAGGPESQVRGLRRQDVVLLQNVAMHVFRGKVYGQSLRGNTTKVSLLWRRDGSGRYSGRDLMARRKNVSPQTDKARKVKDWVLRFVGGDHQVTKTTTTTTRKARKSWDKPPDDSQ